VEEGADIFRKHSGACEMRATAPPMRANGFSLIRAFKAFAALRAATLSVFPLFLMCPFFLM
jgi:hypothetical protein